MVVCVAVALVAAGIVAALIVPGSGSGGPVLSGDTGRPAPGFSLPQLTDPAATLTLARLRGKNVVVNFWASWCSPCQAEMPVLQAAAVRSRGKVVFVGIDANDTRDAAIGFLRRVPVTYPTLFDPNGSVAISYGLFGLPTTVFVSPTGKLLGRHSGQLDAATLQSALRQAFGSSAGA